LHIHFDRKTGNRSLGLYQEPLDKILSPESFNRNSAKEKNLEKKPENTLKNPYT